MKRALFFWVCFMALAVPGLSYAGSLIFGPSGNSVGNVFKLTSGTD